MFFHGACVYVCGRDGTGGQRAWEPWEAGIALALLVICRSGEGRPRDFRERRGTSHLRCAGIELSHLRPKAELLIVFNIFLIVFNTL